MQIKVLPWRLSENLFVWIHFHLLIKCVELVLWPSCLLSPSLWEREIRGTEEERKCLLFIQFVVYLDILRPTCLLVVTSFLFKTNICGWLVQIMDGGFRDKPGKSRDFYHTCYCLSGLSVCQYINLETADSSPIAQEVLGPYSNLLEQTHPLYNVVLERYYSARELFSHL